MNNAEIEAAWVEAWDSVLTLAGKRRDFRCMLPDGSLVDVETCLGWLQESVYAGHAVSVDSCWILGRPGALVSRKGTGVPVRP